MGVTLGFQRKKLAHAIAGLRAVKNERGGAVILFFLAAKQWIDCHQSV